MFTVSGMGRSPTPAWVGSVPRLFSRSLYSGLIIDQDCNGCSFGHLYLSGDLEGAVTNTIPSAAVFPNWDPYGLPPSPDPNVQPDSPAPANQLRTGLVVMSGDPASAEVVVCEAWNVGGGWSITQASPATSSRWRISVGGPLPSMPRA